MSNDETIKNSLMDESKTASVDDSTSTTTTNKLTIQDEEETYVGKKVKQKRANALATTPVTSSLDQNPIFNAINANSKNSVTQSVTNSNTIQNLSAHNSQIVQSETSRSSTNSGGRSGASSPSSGSDPRHMDAADTLMSLAHSASSTPTVESKPFPVAQLNQSAQIQSTPANIEIYVTTANNENESGVIEKTINLAEIGSKMEATVGEADSAIKPGCPNTKELVESACKILVEQVLKKCPNVNLSSITIKTTTAKPNNDSVVAKDASETNPSVAITTASNSNINATTSTTTTQIIQLKPTTLEISNPKPARNKHRFEDSGSTTASISPSSHSTTSSSSSIDTSIAENAAKKLRASDDEKLKKNESVPRHIDLNNDHKPSLTMSTSVPTATIQSTSAHSATTRTVIKIEDSIIPMDENDDESNQSSSSSNLNQSRSSVGSSTKNRNKSHASIEIRSVRPAPTLATGRKSKDVELPPDEAKKRQERRERNKEAAARCRRRREDLTQNLTEKTNQLRKQQEMLQRELNDLVMEKSRLETMWRSHEKSCRPNSLNTSSNHFVQNQQQHQSSQNHAKVVKRDEMNDLVKTNQQNDKKQAITPTNITTNAGLIPNQPQPPSILRSSPQGTLSIPSAIQTSLEDQKSLNMFLNANSALLTPKSAFANNTIENLLLNQIDQQNSSNSVGGALIGSNKLQSPSQSQYLDFGANIGSGSTLQRPNNLNLKGSSLANTPTGLGNSPSSASITSAVLQNLMAYMNNGGVNSATSTSNQPYMFLGGTPSTIQSKLNFLAQTPALQLNTPTLLALTPIEATLSAFSPILSSIPQFPQQQHQP